MRSLEEYKDVYEDLSDLPTTTKNSEEFKEILLIGTSILIQSFEVDNPIEYITTTVKRYLDKKDLFEVFTPEDVYHMLKNLMRIEGIKIETSDRKENE